MRDEYPGTEPAQFKQDKMSRKGEPMAHDDIIEEKSRSLINPRLREIHENIGATFSMGDLAVYIGQPMAEIMAELAEFVKQRERQRAVEICDLTIPGLVDRERCAKALRDPNTKHPSMLIFAKGRQLA